MKIPTNTEIAFTYLFSRGKMTIVASLGVTFGISMFIFMNSLISGTNEYMEKTMLSSTPHIRLYRDNELSRADQVSKKLKDRSIPLIANPQLVNESNNIRNPEAVLQLIRRQKDVVTASKQINTNVIYSNGIMQENGNVFGVNILEQDNMFDISSSMIAGSVRDLVNNPNGIIIGARLAERLNLKKGDHIFLTTQETSTKMMEVAGIFKTTIKTIDLTKSYANIPVVQQLIHKDRNYITDIYINIRDNNLSPETARKLENLTGYTAESWQESNEQLLAAIQIRNIIANAMVVTILIVAGFGIYNILNMMIYEKIKEIAILKATGFQGKHVVSIFIQQALFIGIIGATIGVTFGWLLSLLGSKFYLGMGNVEYLPMSFYLRHYIQGSIFGVLVSFFAGYIPAIKASKVDPVEIIRG